MVAALVFAMLFPLGIRSVEAGMEGQDDITENNEWIRNRSNLIRFKIEKGVFKDSRVKKNCDKMCSSLMSGKRELAERMQVVVANNWR